MSKPKILVVDDEPKIQKVVRHYLKREGYHVVVAEDGEEAIRMVKNQDIDLICLDVMLPKIHGFEVCRRIKQDPKHRLTPIIMLTALHEIEDQVQGIEAGADDYILKPINKKLLLARIKSLLKNHLLTKQLENVQNVLISLAKSLEAKDPYTEGHSQRVSNYSAKLAIHTHSSDVDVAVLKQAALLHDIGKIGVPELVLNKPSRLNDSEYSLIKKHPAIGEEICQPLHSLSGTLGLIRHHHEHFDGTGYPDGLKGEELSIATRIISIADAYDAMNSSRAYRKKLSHDDIICELKQGAGSQWDPDLIDIFITKVINTKGS